MGAYEESRVAALLGASIPVTVLALIAVVARLLARRASAARLWWDDYVIVAAMVFSLTFTTLYWVQVRYGLGRHTKAHGGPVSQNEVEMYFHVFMPLQVFYFASAVTIKTSLILLYYRIFSVFRWFRWILGAAWMIVLLYFLICMMVAIFECKPVAFFWDKSIPGGRCINEDAFYRWNGVANLLIDFMVLILTLPVVWRLNLTGRQKFSLSGVFLLGLLACVASIVRVITFSEVDFSDMTYTIVPASYWTTIEQSVGIICGCLVTMRNLFDRFVAKIQARGKGSTSSSAYLDSRERTIPLKNYKYGRNNKDSLDGPRNNFVRLDEEREEHPMAMGTTSTASKGPDEEASIVPEKILRTQEIDQHFENAVYVV